MQTSSLFRHHLHRLSEVAMAELISLFGAAIDPELMAAEPGAITSRNRIFTPRVTFWAFLSQILTPASSCRQALLKVQSLLLLLKQPPVSPSTSAYCQARTRLSSALLNHLRQKVVGRLESQIKPQDLWMKRHVKIIDATSASFPDTAQNQKRWPQPSEQKPGCGFPVVKICALFSLATGALIANVQSHLNVYDGRLFPRLWKWLSASDVVLADRAFCSFATISSLLRHKVDCVFRLHQRRPVDFRKGRRLGKNDRLIRWKKPLQRTETMSEKIFNSLPHELLLREIKFSIDIPGFRTRKVFLVTTLLDPKMYPPSSLAELFRRRWNAEINFRDIKTTMGMERLRSQSPSMALKELTFFFIAYNLVRLLMFEAAQKNRAPLQSISFKGTVDLLTSCTWLFHQRLLKKQLRLNLLRLIANDPLPYRPNRSEPRAIKRRPKSYQYLTQPRRLMETIPHREHYRKILP